jgi:K+-sensing histidine kinase KdpD
MLTSKGAVPVVASLGMMSLVTAILWHIKLTETSPHHLIYLYLLPVILIAIVHSGRLALLAAAIAVFCADYFLQDPIYSLANDNPLEYGDLLCFAVLAATAIKSVREIMRPGEIQQAKRPVTAYRATDRRAQ